MQKTTPLISVRGVNLLVGAGFDAYKQRTRLEINPRIKRESPVLKNHVIIFRKTIISSDSQKGISLVSKYGLYLPSRKGLVNYVRKVLRYYVRKRG